MKKYLAYSGAIVTTVVPLLSIVACNQQHSIHQFDSENNDNIDKPNGSSQDSAANSWDDKAANISVPYTPASLMAEAQQLYSGQTSSPLWKNGLRYESMTQAISLLTNFTEAYGWDLKKEFAKLNSDASQSFRGIVIDSSNENKTAREILDDAGLSSLSAKFPKTIAEVTTTIQHAQNITVDPAPIHDLKEYSLAAPNQTVDSVNDFNYSHLVTSEPLIYSESNNGVAGEFYSESGFYTHAWYDAKNPGTQMIAFGRAIDDKDPDLDPDNPSSISFQVVRVLASKGIAEKNYAVIQKEHFDQDYVPVVKQAILNFVEMAGRMISVINSMHFLSPSLASAISYIYSTNTDDQSNFKIDDDKLQSTLEDLNQTGTINWLAVKALYLGYDASFQDNGYDIYQNSDWKDDKTNNNNISVPSKGISSKDDWNPLMLRTWMHKNDGSLFDPTLSIQDNYKLNNKTYPTI